MPKEISVTLCAEDGKALRTVVRKVERGLVADIPAIAGASKLRLVAAGFDEVTILISAARASGVALPPLASLTVEGLLPRSADSAERPVRIWLRRKGSSEATRIDERADENGRVPLSLPAGEWDLAFQPAGFAASQLSESVAVGERRTISSQPVAKGLRVRIVVKDGKGQPVPGARASWSLAGSPTPEELRKQGRVRLPYTLPLLEVAVNSAERRTDADGAILGENIPDLPQAWTIQAEGFRRQRSRLRQDPEITQLDLAITLRDLPTLALSVRDLTGQKADLTLEMTRRPIESPISAPYGPFWKGGVLADATRQFPRIPEGEYRLDLRGPGGVLQTREELSPLDADWDRPEIRRTLVREPRTVTGRIMMGEAPLEGVLFFPRFESPWPQRDDTVYPLDRLAEFAPRSDPDGRFAIVVGGPGRYLIDYTSPDSPIRGTTRVVDLTTDRQAWVDVLVPAGRVDVRVIDADGELPVPNATLRIQIALPNGDTRQTVAQSDANGRYALAGFDPSATISITASSKGFGMARREVSGPQAEPLVFALRHAKGLLFRMTDPFGAPIAGAEIRRPEPAQQIGNVGGAGYARIVARADSSGIAEIEHPELGPHPYFAMAAGFQIDVVIASPTEGGDASESNEVNVVLHRIEVGNSISLRDRAGRPVRSAALAFAKLGTVVPWGLMIEKAMAEGGRAQALLLSDYQGATMSHQLLAPGNYQVFQYRPPTESDPHEQFAPLGSLQLPLAGPAVLTLQQLSKGGN